MHQKIFIAGVILFTASFLMPIGDGDRGYMLALLVFNMSYDAIGVEELLNILALTVTNLAALIILISYFKFQSGLVSLLGLAGILIALYWVIILLIDTSFQILPFATLGWMLGMILLTLGYELRRRKAT